MPSPSPLPQAGEGKRALNFVLVAQGTRAFQNRPNEIDSGTQECATPNLHLLTTLALTLAACGKQESAPPPQTSTQPPAAPKPAPVVPSPEGQSTPDITAADFAARVKKISGDAFEGRKPGTIGERMTTAWIKDQFELTGLKPGNGGNWFQTVPMIETTLQEPESVTLDVATANGDERFAYRTDMIVNTLDASHDVSIEGSPIVFAGYGVVAPEQNWNDYAGLDVKGKTVVVLVNDPGWGNNDATLFKGKALTYYGRWTYKYEEAARQGAAACLIVHETPGAGYRGMSSSTAGPARRMRCRRARIRRRICRSPAGSRRKRRSGSSRRPARTSTNSRRAPTCAASSRSRSTPSSRRNSRTASTTAAPRTSSA